MTVPNNAYRRQDQTNVLEDYDDVIYDVSPWETPFVSNASQDTATNSLVEFTEDKLDAPADPATSDGNSWLDGDDFTGAAITPPTKLGNQAQIQRKDIAISRRAQIVYKAGEDDEVARQSIRKGRELRRDMETTALYNQAARAETGTTVALTAGLPTWIAGTSDGRANRGATGTDPTGDGSDVKVDGTKRALSEVGMLGVHQAVWTVSTLDPDMWLVDPTTKRNFSRYMFSSSARVANQYQDQGTSPAKGGVSVTGAVMEWETDFGRTYVYPDRYMPVRAESSGYDAFLMNGSYQQLKFLTNMRVYVMGRSGDSERRIILVDWAYVPRNRNTLGTFADVDESLAMVA